MKTTIRVFAMILGILIILISISCKKDDGEEDAPGETSQTFTDDRDGKVYKWVKIGDQVWMAENLAFKTTTGCWAYDNIEDSVDVYGYLYDWNAAMIAAPDGWHLPSDDEWKILEGNADTQFGVGHSVWDSIYLRGSDAAIRLKSESGWLSGYNGTDIFGFSVLPAGIYRTNNDFGLLGEAAFFWSSTESSPGSAWERYFIVSYAGVGRESKSKDYGRSVRCVKDQ